VTEILLNVDQVAGRLGTKRRTVLKRRHDDNFPKAIRVAGGYDGLRWAESEIDGWIQEKMAERE